MASWTDYFKSLTDPKQWWNRVFHTYGQAGVVPGGSTTVPYNRPTGGGAAPFPQFNEPATDSYGRPRNDPMYGQYQPKNMTEAQWADQLNQPRTDAQRASLLGGLDGGAGGGGYGSMTPDEYNRAIERSAAYRAAKENLARKYEENLTLLAKHRAEGLKAIGLIPGRINAQNQQSMDDLRSFASALTAGAGGDALSGNVLPVPIDQAGFNESQVAQPFLSAVDVLNKDRVAQNDLLNIGEEQFITGQQGLLQNQYYQAQADLDAQRAKAVEDYLHDQQIERERTAGQLAQLEYGIGLSGGGAGGGGSALKTFFQQNPNAYSALRAQFLSDNLINQAKQSSIYAAMDKAAKQVGLDNVKANPEGFLSQFNPYQHPLYVSVWLRDHGVAINPQDKDWIPLQFS